MRKRRQVLPALAYFLLDLLLTVGAWLAAVWIRAAMQGEFDKDFYIERHIWEFPVVALAWAPLLWIWGVTRGHRTDKPSQEAWRLVKIIVIGSLALVLFTEFILKWTWLSRGTLAFFVLFDFILLGFFRTLSISIAHHQRKRGYDRSYVIVAGTGKNARNHVKEIRLHPEWGVEVLGMLSEQPGLALEEVAGVKVLGSIEDLPDLLRKEVVDEVHFAVSRRTLARLDDPVRACDDMGVTVRISLGMLSFLKSRMSVSQGSGGPLLTLSSTPPDSVSLVVKRLFDIVSSSVAIVAGSPVLFLAALAVKLSSPGPVIFRQKRSGMNGRVFTLYKFRTMVADAEARRSDLEAKNEMDGPVFKIKKDPRITRVGGILRKLSIDELPQLWNVLRGDMSIVGPRPPIPAEVEKYERWQRRRLSMRPGITCIWQVSGRSNIDFKRWMEMDLEYIDNWSLGLDLKIIVKTIPAVLGSRGAS